VFSGAVFFTNSGSSCFAVHLNIVCIAHDSFITLQSAQGFWKLALRESFDGCRTENDSHKGISKSSKEDWSGPFEWDDRAADIRLNVFGIASYRQNQREV